MADATTEEKKPNIVSHVISVVLSYLRQIFTPILTALVAAGVLQGITILLHTFGIIQPDTAEYNLMTTMSSCVFYYIPIMLAYTSASVFKTNHFVAMSVAFFLVYPENVSQLQIYGGHSDFFGLPLPPGNYPNSVIPIILIVWAQSYVEKFFNKIIPDIVKGIFVPTLTLFVTDVLAISIIGPIGTFVADCLSKILLWLADKVPWLTPMLMGGFGLFIVMTGAHYSLIPVATQSITSVGYDTFFIPGQLASNLALAGAVMAVYFKTKKKDYKSYCLTSAVTASLGVSQPGLYGVALYFKQGLIGAIIGGLCGGLYAGIFHVYAYAFVNPGLAAIPAFINPDGTWTNLINCLIVIAISFIVAFIITYVAPYTDLTDDQVKDITSDEDEEKEEHEEAEDVDNDGDDNHQSESGSDSQTTTSESAAAASTSTTSSTT